MRRESALTAGVLHPRTCWAAAGPWPVALGVAASGALPLPGSVQRYSASVVGGSQGSQYSRQDAARRCARAK